MGIFKVDCQYLRGNLIYCFLNFINLFVFLCLVCGCGPSIKANIESQGPKAEQVIKYHGPKARIAIADILCKTKQCDNTLADAATDMLATSLFQTGRFILLERGIGLQFLKQEIDLNQGQYVNIKRAVPQGLLEGADVLILGVITALKPNESGLIVPIVVPWKHHGDQNVTGGILVEKKAYLAMEIRLIDVRTGRVIKAVTVEGRAKDWRVMAGGGKIGKTKATGTGIDIYQNTPLAKALDVMIKNAVSAIVKDIPLSYYRYRD